MRISDGKESRPFVANHAFQCSCCETWFEAGTLARYVEQDRMVNSDPGHDELDSYDPGESVKLGKQKIEVMPRGKTAKDRCDRCFTIHTPGQGEECQ